MMCPTWADRRAGWVWAQGRLLAREPALRASGSNALEVLAAVGGATKELSTADENPLTLEPPSARGQAARYTRSRGCLPLVATVDDAVRRLLRLLGRADLAH